MDKDQQTSGLSESCDAILGRWDMYATQSSDLVSNIYNEEGEYLIRVSCKIDAYDLLALLRYGRFMRDIGFNAGEESIKTRFRLLIGAAPIETKSDTD